MKTLEEMDLDRFCTIVIAVGEGDPVEDLDAQIAECLGSILRPLTTSLEAVYELMDELAQDEEYVNVDFREYRQNNRVLCDINDDYGGYFGGSGSGTNRREALLQAVLYAAHSSLSAKKSPEEFYD